MGSEWPFGLDLADLVLAGYYLAGTGLGADTGSRNTGLVFEAVEVGNSGLGIWVVS